MLSREANKPKPIEYLPHHIWANNPEVAKIRRSLFIFWIRTSIIFWLLIFLVALIYLGSGVNPTWYTQSLDVFVNNFDNGLAGKYFIEAFQETPSGNQTLNWIFQQASDQSSIIQQIEGGSAWASVYMNAGTSDRLNEVFQSIQSGKSYTSSYVPSSATTIVYDEGRNFNTINAYVLPPIRAAIAVASARYSAYIQSQAANLSNVTLDNIISSISVANITYSPISYTTMNLHPAVPYASFLATTLGYLFLWLIMLALVGMIVRITQPLAGKAKIIDIIIIRIISTTVNGLMVSLIFSLSILWFSNFTQAVPFIRFWLFNWLAVITYGVIIAIFTLNLGPLAQVGLIIFLILNLASSSTNIAIELQHRFYRIGYGLPLFHCFNGGRHLLFGSYTQLNVDIGVLFAYYFAAVILAIATAVYRMRKQLQQVREKNRILAIFRRYHMLSNISNRKI